MILELRANSKTAAPADTTPLTPTRLSRFSLLSLFAYLTLAISRLLASVSILRLLATGHYLTEVKPDVFANNRVSSYIDSGQTVAQLRTA